MAPLDIALIPLHFLVPPFQGGATSARWHSAVYFPRHLWIILLHCNVI